jgi:hypothetical protein
MLSPAAMGAAQCGQRERGRTMDSWRGRREMQTLRKLPKARPRRTTKVAMNRIRDWAPLPIYLSYVQLEVEGQPSTRGRTPQRCLELCRPLRDRFPFDHPSEQNRLAGGPGLRGVLRLRADWLKHRWRSHRRRFAQDDIFVVVK